MELSTLQTFAAVARAGSFAARARETGVDPSAISRAIAGLEEELGWRLFDRTTRRLALTEAGRLYLDRVAPLLRGLAEAAEVAGDAVNEPIGRLVITSSVAFGERWLLPRVETFRARYPRITFDLRLTDATVDMTSEGVDLALRLGPRVEGSLVAAKLFETRYHVVAAPDYVRRHGAPTEPSDLATHDGVMFPLPGYRSRWRLRRSGSDAVVEVSPKPVLTISNALALRRAALSGLGVALLADWTVAHDIARGRLVDLFPSHEATAADFDTAAWIVYPTRDYVPSRLRVFVEHLRSG